MITIKMFAFQMSTGLVLTSLLISDFGKVVAIIIVILIAILLVAFIKYLISSGSKGSEINRTNIPTSKRSPSLPRERTTVLELKDEINQKNRTIEELKKTIDEQEKVIDYLNNEIIKLNGSLNRKNDKRRDRPEPEEDESRSQKQVSGPAFHQSLNYTYLTVLEGPLVEAGPEHAIYYKAWKSKGKTNFEFVNNERTKKAINNRTSIIEPFCEKVESSKSPDDSNMITTITPGILNEDFSVIEKAKIEYK